MISRGVRNLATTAVAAATVVAAASSVSPTSPASAAAAQPAALLPPSPRATADAPSVEAAPEGFTRIDLSRIPLGHHLLHSALAGDDLVEKYELFVSKDGKNLQAKARLGHLVCGHPSIVHGGAIASLLDDTLGTLFLSMGQNGFTANLNVNYRKPLTAGTDVLVVAALDRIETSASGSQKVFLKGSVVNAADPSIVYTEASALFIAKAVPTSGGSKHTYSGPTATAPAAAPATGVPPVATTPAANQVA